jgi:hypothetical protein
MAEPQSGRYSVFFDGMKARIKKIVIHSGRECFSASSETILRALRMVFVWTWGQYLFFWAIEACRKLTRIFSSVDRISKQIPYSWSAQPVPSIDTYFAWNGDKKISHNVWGYPRDEKVTHRKVQNGSVQNARDLTLILGQIGSGWKFETSKPYKPPHLLYRVMIGGAT